MIFFLFFKNNQKREEQNRTWQNIFKIHKEKWHLVLKKKKRKIDLGIFPKIKWASCTLKKWASCAKKRRRKKGIVHIWLKQPNGRVPELGLTRTFSKYINKKGILFLKNRRKIGYLVLKRKWASRWGGGRKSYLSLSEVGCWREGDERQGRNA